MKHIILFQKYCEKAINKLTPEIVEHFKTLTDEESRIATLYDIGKNISIELTELNGKDRNEAELCKIQGNKYFANKDYHNALNFYTKGAIVCPQDTVESRQLFTIIISNRSATYFELKEYKKVFNDIDYILEIGDYPPHLMYKIWLRKAKCYEELQNQRMSNEAYKQALESLNHSKLDENTLSKKQGEIENAMKCQKQCDSRKISERNNEIIPFCDVEIFHGGNEYLSANPKITIAQDSHQGRYAKATENIEVGSTLVEENAYAAVLDAEHSLTNCQFCAISVEQAVACPYCADVIFCSSNCQRLAQKTFHGIECGLQRTLFTSGASVNCLLALRMITQKPFSYFRDKRNKLKDYLRDECKKSIIKKKTYRTDDYDNVFFLCRNEHLRKKEELIHYACMSVYLLRLLKSGNYFAESDDETLNDYETYIGALILRHLQLLQFNAHEMSQIQNIVAEQPITNFTFNCHYENVTIGAAVYPTLALFNHSCDPSVVRYNIRNKIVVKAIKPINADDTIYENYGPLYMSETLEERQNELKTNYWFECLCQPCVEMWPQFHEMNERQLRIPCKSERCPYVFVIQDEEDPFLTCRYCHQTTNLFPHLKGLMVLEQLLPEAEDLFRLGQLENAVKKFLKGLEILYKYSMPPHPEIIKVQQRVRSCLLHLGNKTWNYKFLP